MEYNNKEYAQKQCFFFVFIQTRMRMSIYEMILKVKLETKIISEFQEDFYNENLFSNRRCRIHRL